MCLLSEGVSPCSLQGGVHSCLSLVVSGRGWAQRASAGMVMLGVGICVGHGDSSRGRVLLWLLVCESLATGTGQACWKYDPGLISFLVTLCSSSAHHNNNHQW